VERFLLKEIYRNGLLVIQMEDPEVADRLLTTGEYLKRADYYDAHRVEVYLEGNLIAAEDCRRQPSASA
jgi:hypothetical protein